MKIDSVYIATTNRPRAEQFWSDVLNQSPESRNETFTFFNLGGVLFLLFDPVSVGEERRLMRGNNCVPCIRVDDADAEHERLARIAHVVLPIHSVGPYRVFQIADEDENVVEFYSEAN